MILEFIGMAPERVSCAHLNAARLQAALRPPATSAVVICESLCTDFKLSGDSYSYTVETSRKRARRQESSPPVSFAEDGEDSTFTFVHNQYFSCEFQFAQMALEITALPTQSVCFQALTRRRSANSPSTAIHSASRMPRPNDRNKLTEN